MACKTETRQIGDHEYTVTQWPAQKAILTKLKLVKTFGAALSILAGDTPSAKSKSKDKEEAEALSNGLTALFNNSSPEELLKLMTDCIVGIMCDDKRITITSFDEIFSGEDLLDVYKVFLFVMQVNYGNLMKGQLAENFLAKMKEKL
jgi:hypothetical protein